MPQFKDISTLTKKAVVSGDEKIAVSGTEFITPSQIGGNTTIATPLSDGLMSASDKQKMNGIASGANNYTHPDNPNTRHVTDAEKAAWNNKASTAIATQLRNGLMSASDKQRLDNIEGGGGTPPPVPDHPVYIFKESDTQPGKPTNMTTSDLNNDADGFWKDYPDAIGSWWGCIGIVDGAKQKGDSGYIKSWSETFPTTGQNGSSVEFRWKDMPKGERPVFTEDKRAKRMPDGWTADPSELTDGYDRWQTSATITSDGSIAGLWAVAYKISGEDGLDGTDGRVPNSTVQVFKQSSSQPGAPIDTAHIPPQGSGVNAGWVRVPNNTGNWWQCVGAVDGSKTSGETGYVTWGEVLLLNGQNGQDGRSTEIRFKAVSIGTLPTLTAQEKMNRNISGWTVDTPEVSDLQYLWMIVGIINPNNTMSGSGWANPRRITGPTGPKGDDGPAGNDGVDGRHGIDGLPGITIEMRYSVGPASGPVAISPEGLTTRQPAGWTTTLPSEEVTQANPYIWFTQSRIIYTDNQQAKDNPYTEGIVSSPGWEKPARLSGTNGTNGTPGSKGQIVFPAGVYSPDKEYICTNEKAPYVYDDGNFYVLNYTTEEPWIGNKQQYKTPHEVVAAGQRWWIKFESFEALYTKIGIISNGLIGSAVFNGDYAISQQGVDASGNKSFDYENFNASNPEQLFRVFWPTAGNIKPERPTSKNIADFILATSSTLEVKWQRCPIQDSVVCWYECDGVVDSSTNTIKEWCEPFLYYDKISLVGIRYAKNNNPLIPPYLDTPSTSTAPLGWSSDYGEMLPISSSEKLWFTTGLYKSGKNILYQHPICANGPVKSKPVFTPNVMINYATGEGHLAVGKVRLYADGDVEMRDIKVRNAIVSGYIEAKTLNLGLFDGASGDMLTDSAMVISSRENYILPALSPGVCREIRFCVPIKTRVIMASTIATENSRVNIVPNGNFLDSNTSYQVGNIQGFRALFIGYCEVDYNIETTYWMMYTSDVV